MTHALEKKADDDLDDFECPPEVSPYIEIATVFNNRLAAIDDLHSVIESKDIDKRHDEIEHLLCATGLEGTLHLEDITGESVALEDAQQETLKEKIFSKAKSLLSNIASHMHNLFSKCKTLVDTHTQGLQAAIKNIPSKIWEKMQHGKEYVKVHPVKTMFIFLGATAAACAALPFLAELPAIKESLVGLYNWADKIFNVLSKNPLVGKGLSLTRTKTGAPRFTFPRVRKGFRKVDKKIQAAKSGWNASMVGRMFSELRRLAHFIGVALGTIGAAAGKIIHVYVTKFVGPMYAAGPGAGRLVMNATGSGAAGTATTVGIWTWITALNAVILGTVTYTVLKFFLNMVATVKGTLRQWGLIDETDSDADLRDTDSKDF